jgi:hypothetical protein
MNFITQYSYDPSNHEGEINDDPDMTLPDQAYTVKQLLERHMAGLPIDVSTNLNYDEDDDSEDGFENFDILRSEGFDATDAEAFINNVTGKGSERIGPIEEKESRKSDKSDGEADQRSGGEVESTNG